MATILGFGAAQVLTAGAILTAAAYVAEQVIRQAEPVITPIAAQAKDGSGLTTTVTGADKIRSCSQVAAGGTSEGSTELCITPDGLISDPGRALTTSDNALSPILQEGSDAIGDAIRAGGNNIAANPLSSGPNGRAS